MKKAVFLDRDGVINPVVLKNGKPYPPLPNDYSIFGNAPEAISKLKNAGYLVFIFTNQPDVTKKIITEEELSRIHHTVSQKLSIDEIVVCTHVEEDQCQCRKPRIGMLLYLQNKWDIDLCQSIVVGDRWRDIEAGTSAGCKTILIGDGYNEKKITASGQVDNILEASNLILTWEKR